MSRTGDWPEDALKKPGLQMRSVWSIHPPKKEEKKYGKHPTQKPINLLRRIILTSTSSNDLILDPFNGGGTTGIAARMLGRRYVGIDLEKEYLDLTINRFGDL